VNDPGRGGSILMWVLIGTLQRRQVDSRRSPREETKEESAFRDKQINK
jgi:hypothetical protein